MNAHHVDVHQPGHFPCPGEKCGKVMNQIEFENWINKKFKIPFKV